MPTLNFPTNPTVNEQYSFGGKTWYWTGQAWRLTTQGAINGIPIGNITPSTGNFTNLTANTVQANNLSVSGDTTLENLSIAGSYIGNLDVSGQVRTNELYVDNDSYFSGNVTTAQYFYGNGSQLTGIVASTGNSLSFGLSNVQINSANGNVEFNVANVRDVLVVSDTQIIPGVPLIPADPNIDVGSVTDPFREGYFSGNLTAGNFIGNVIGNISGNLTISAGNTQVVYSSDGTAVGSPKFTFNQASNVVGVTGNITATGNIQANYLLGNATALTGAMVDRGPDTNDWNALTQMGVYTVNRTSWAGTTGTPLDSQVFVGLLEVKNSTGTALEQLFFPGTVTSGNVKIQWNRSYWSGSWTAWIKIVNDDQVFTGGTF